MFKKSILPFIIFISIAGFLALGLNRNPGEIPSPHIGKPAPQFELPLLPTDDQSLVSSTTMPTISKADMLGKVWLMNVWASWCVACRVEHPLLIQLAENKLVEIIGLNYKDTNDAAHQWLMDHGNPYSLVAVDAMGDVGIDYGVYGVPETFVIDQNGFVQLKHVGPLTPTDLKSTIVPLIMSLKMTSN